MIVDITNVLNDTFGFNFASLNGNRSNKRTTALHKGIMELYLEYRNDPQLSIKYEYKIQCFWGKTFNCDAVIFKNGEIESVFLFKLHQASILKNLFNSLNTTIGEIFRIVGSDNYIKQPFNMVFLEFMPKKTLVFSGKNYKIEDVFKRFAIVRKILTHPWFSGMKNLYVEKIWYVDNGFFTKALRENKIDGKCVSYDSYIENVTFDLSKLP